MSGEINWYVGWYHFDGNLVGMFLKCTFPISPKHLCETQFPVHGKGVGIERNEWLYLVSFPTSKSGEHVFGEEPCPFQEKL